MSTKHTPGPWIWGDEYHGLFGAGPDNAVLDHATYEGMWLQWNDRRDANASLIAAAPELLTALIDCVHVMERELNGLAVIQPELRQARDAIAKATGEA